METNKLIAGIVAAAIAIIVLAGVLMPALSNATTTEDTLTNEGYFRAIETEEETVIKWNPSVAVDTINVNGENIALPILNNNLGVSIAFADDFVLRVYFLGGHVSNIQFWRGGYVVGQGSTSTYEGTFTINSTGASFVTNAPDAVATSITHDGSYFVIDPDGDMIMKDSTKPAYLLEDSSVIYAGGVSYVGNNNNTMIYIEGTVDNLSMSNLIQSPSSLTFDDVTIDSESYDQYIGVIALNKITFTTSYVSGGNTYTQDQTYSYFLVPYEITAERSVHLTDAMNVILNVIPLLIIVAVLLGVVAVFILRRE